MWRECYIFIYTYTLIEIIKLKIWFGSDKIFNAAESALTVIHV